MVSPASSLVYTVLLQTRGGMRISGIITVLAAASCIAVPASADTFTLSDALVLAYTSNPRLAQARAALDALDQGVAQANAGWRPTVSAGGSYGIQHDAIYGTNGNPFASPDGNGKPLTGQISIMEPIFRGGRTYAEVKRAIAQVRAGRAELVATEQSVLLATVTAYVDVVRDTKILKINRDNLSSLQIELDAVHTELAAGEVTRTDALQAEARLARARSDEAAAEQQLAASRATFEDVIGTPPSTLDDKVQSPRTPGTKDAALNIALSQNPNLLQTKADELAASYQVDDAVGALLPEISVIGQFQYLKDASSSFAFTKHQQNEVSVIGQVNVPIYQGGGEEATVRRAEDLHSQANLAIISAQRDVRQNVDSSWQALRSAELAITANQSQQTADQGAVEGVREEQQGGERSVLDVLNAQQELFSAEVSLVTAEHDRIVAAYRLLSSTGQLTARYLNLNVQLYDPRIHYNDNSDAWFGFDE